MPCGPVAPWPSSPPPLCACSRSPLPGRTADGDDTLPAVSAAPPTTGGCVKAATRRLGQAPWAQGYLGLDRAWASGQGAGTTVAVLDTGVDAHHSPALAGRVEAGPDVTRGAGPSSRRSCVAPGRASARRGSPGG